MLRALHEPAKTPLTTAPLSADNHPASCSVLERALNLRHQLTRKFGGSPGSTCPRAKHTIHFRKNAVPQFYRPQNRILAPSCSRLGESDVAVAAGELGR